MFFEKNRPLYRAGFCSISQFDNTNFVEQKDMPNLEIVAVEDAELENESKLEQKQRPRLLTRRRIVDYVREVHGVPITKSTIDKLAMQERGPKVTAFYGRVELSTPAQVDEWVAAELCNAAPKKLGA
jgi:hypothetical protein